MLPDDTLWVGASGKLSTKAQILAVTRANFQKNPTKTKKDASPHDDFGIRRFGDVIVQHGRSTTMKPDGTKSDARRYLIVLQKQRGQWWVIGRDTIPIDHIRPPDSPEILAIEAKAKPSTTSKIILGRPAEPEVEKEILRLSAVQNQAAVRATATRPAIVCRRRHHVDEPTGMSRRRTSSGGARANFAKNPEARRQQADDFTVRRFGDTVIQIGRSTH